jgi:deoxyribose-phosphate aldolase
MNIDFAIIDTDLNEIEVKELIKKIISYNIVNTITVPYYLLKYVKNISDITGTSCLIDFPMGIADPATRLFSIEQAHKAGANTVDIVMPQNLAANRKYDKIREDVKNVTKLCTDLNLTPKYILEYRIFDHHCLKKICEIFDQYNIRYVYPSTGYFLDNLADNILAGIFLYQNSKDLNIYCTGNIWTNKHFLTMQKSGLYGFRTTSEHTLANFVNFSVQSNNTGV